MVALWIVKVALIAVLDQFRVTAAVVGVGADTAKVRILGAVGGEVAASVLALAVFE